MTSLIEILELPNFGHMTTSIIWFESRDKILLVTSWAEIMMSWPFFQNIFILQKPGVAIFADIIKVVTVFSKTIFKNSRKVKWIRNYVSKCNICLYSLI